MEGFPSVMESFVVYAIKDLRQAHFGEKLHKLIVGPHLIKYLNKREGLWLVVIPAPAMRPDEYAHKLIERLAGGEACCGEAK